MSSYYFFQKKNKIPPLCLPMPMCSGLLLLLKQPVWLRSTLSPRGALSSPFWVHFSPSCLPQERFLKLQFSSVAQFCPTLCDPMSPSTPGLPVHHQLLELAQTHVHCVGDDIQPSHPLWSPFPPALNPSQHQGLFQFVSSSHQVAKRLEFQLQHQSFQRTVRIDLLYDGLVGSPCSLQDSQESSPTLTLGVTLG